ncbi:glycosyltransferase family 2 protein [Candidatus Roizmanbacteria bacterium]|nr:glycosyltransferase family 2 protein [Candidatus Roizmanbacteria bacterium]
MKRAVIILPTYNEVENIQKLIPLIFQIAKTVPNWELHIVIVDSHSNDGTEEKVLTLIKKYPHLHLIRMKKEGLGKAYIEGFRIAIEKLNPYLLFEMDADLSHNPDDIPKLLKKVEEGSDFVIGARYIQGGSIPQNWGLHRKIFSVLANLFVRFGFMKPKISDWTSGFRAIKSWIIKEAFDHIKRYSGYVFQIALLDYAITKNARISQIPIHFKDRTSGVSKINAPQFIITTVLYVLTHSAFIKFVIVGLLGFVVDFVFAYVFINSFHINKPVSNMLSAEIAIMSNFILNNFWSFRYKKIEGGVISYGKKFITFNLVSSGSIIIQGTGLTIALRIFGDTIIHLLLFNLSSWILYKIVIIAFIIIPYSYILYNKFIWRGKK